jgi:predicted peptidase
MLVVAGMAGLACGCASPGSKPAVAAGQQVRSLAARVTVPVSMNYLLYVPEGYAASRKRWPLILFLHGAGERGDDIEMVKKHGPPKLVAEGRALPFVVLSPQCPKEGWWSGDAQVAALDALLKETVSNLRIDERRIYVTGLSMGGFGTWRLAAEFPRRFAAIAPICGKGDPAKAESIRHVPAWVFHGAKDEAVPLKNSEDMVAALKAAGGEPKFTVYPEAGHDSWTAAYDGPELYDWFLEHRKPLPRGPYVSFGVGGGP